MKIHEIRTTYVMTSYLSKCATCDPNVSDNGHLTHENDF